MSGVQEVDDQLRGGMSLSSITMSSSPPTGGTQQSSSARRPATASCSLGALVPMLTSSMATSSRGPRPLKMSEAKVRAMLLVVRLQLCEVLLVGGVGSRPVMAARRSSIKRESKTAVRLLERGRGGIRTSESVHERRDEHGSPCVHDNKKLLTDDD